MKVSILGKNDTMAYQRAVQILISKGCTICDTSQQVDVVIAPLLQDKIDCDMFANTTFGVLIFHPSPLPYGRGASSIKHAYLRDEPITAATWFWANERMDAGDICEQEIVKIDYDCRPRIFYEQDIIPAMERTLTRAIDDLKRGIVRRIPQVERYATFDKRL